MEKYIDYLERMIENCKENKDLQREHWAFCQALKKYREFEQLRQSNSVGGASVTEEEMIDRTIHLATGGCMV